MQRRGILVPAALCSIGAVAIILTLLQLPDARETEHSSDPPPSTSARGDSTAPPAPFVPDTSEEVEAESAFSPATPSIEETPPDLPEDPDLAVVPSPGPAADGSAEDRLQSWMRMRRNPRSPEESRDRLAEGPLPTEVPPVLWDITSPVPPIGEDGAIPPLIELEAGWYRLDEGIVVQAPMEALEIRGAGVGRTFVELVPGGARRGRRADGVMIDEDGAPTGNGFVRLRARVESFSLHDLTIIGTDGHLFDDAHREREGGTVGWIERVDFHWSSSRMRIGHSVGSPIRVGSGSTFAFRDVRFASGERGGQGSRAVIELGGENHVLFERCVFQDHETAMRTRPHSGQQWLLFRECVFENTRLGSTTSSRGNPDGSFTESSAFVELESVTIALGPPELPDDERLSSWLGPSQNPEIFATDFTLGPRVVRWTWSAFREQAGAILAACSDGELIPTQLAEIHFECVGRDGSIDVLARPVGGTPRVLRIEGEAVTALPLLVPEREPAIDAVAFDAAPPLASWLSTCPWTDDVEIAGFGMSIARETCWRRVWAGDEFRFETVPLELPDSEP